MDTQSFFSKNYVQVLFTLVLVGIVAALAAYTHFTLKQAKSVYTGETNITVTGEADVMATPDVGTFSFTVMVEAPEAVAAQAEAAEKANAILAYLREQGVEERDIKNEFYGLNPTYSFEERVCPFGQWCPPGEQTINGYQVNQTVMVKVRDLDKAGDLMSGVSERGATNINGIQFTIDDEDALKAEARTAAIADAKAKAAVIAENLGMRLGRMTGFWEEDGQYYPMGYGGMEKAMMSDMPMADGARAPELPAGENTVTSRVNLSFELK